MSRRGFSLLEAMAALAILVVSLAILMETIGSAAIATMEAERIVTATQLAQEKLTEVQLLVEKEGIKERDFGESGDFSDFGDEQFNLEFGELEDYNFSWTVSQIDIGLAGDIASMAESLEGTGLLPTAPEGDDGPSFEDQAPDLGSLGISNDMITEMLGRYIREIRVVVWWGDDDMETAVDKANEVTLVTHVTDPSGGFLNISGQEGQ